MTRSGMRSAPGKYGCARGVARSTTLVTAGHFRRWRRPRPHCNYGCADSQVPWGVDALGGSITEAAWRSKPSWYLVATEDRMIPPPAQRAMSERAGSTVVEAAGSHAIYVSQPAAVASLIQQAASGTG
jgi:pimeloyl-ACP methyl ester carboxylesterase